MFLIMLQIISEIFFLEKNKINKYIEKNIIKKMSRDVSELVLTRLRAERRNWRADHPHVYYYFLF